MLDEFPPEIREDVDGLIWLGHLESQVEIAGHSFALRTLKGNEELLAALLAKKYLDTYGQLQAMAWATVCLSLVSVDGDDDFCPPIGPDEEAFARARFKYCTSKWYWPLCQFLWKEYEKLGERQKQAFEAIENLSPRGLPTSWMLPESLSAPDDSASIPPEIQELVEDSE